MLTYTGTLKVKSDTVKVSDKFKKREFVLTDNSEKYPKTILFQLTQDRCDLLDDAQIGQEVTVTFGLKGREWSNPEGQIKYFNTLDAFKLQFEKKSSIRQNMLKQENYFLTPTPDDDLPF